MDEAARIKELEAEVARLTAKFTKLDMPRYQGAPMLDAVLAVPNEEFRRWAISLPPEYWARYDLSAARIGWEGARTWKDTGDWDEDRIDIIGRNGNEGLHYND